jgi:regulator of protease activity HflC (stomatin/prohibitin superfamily)
MGFFLKFERAVAHKLASVFMGAKKIADHAASDVLRAQAELESAKQKAAILTKEAHQAALAAVARAQAETEALIAEAKLAEEKAAFHADQIANTVETDVSGMFKVVETFNSVPDTTPKM